MFNRKSSEIKEWAHGKRVVDSENDMSDFEVLIFLVAFAAFCDAFFWS